MALEMALTTSKTATLERPAGALGSIGPLEARLAASRVEIRAAQALRYAVFFDEGGATPDGASAAGWIGDLVTLGSGRSDAVLLAHGAGGNAGSWWQQLPAFAARHTVVTFDHRAFGRSPDIEGGPGRAAFATDAIALLDHLGIGRVHIVAWVDSLVRLGRRGARVPRPRRCFHRELRRGLRKGGAVRR